MLKMKLLRAEDGAAITERTERLRVESGARVPTLAAEGQRGLARLLSWYRNFIASAHKVSIFPLSCLPDLNIVARWQMIAGEPQGALEESPNTIRQHAA